jgi:cysteine synthase
MIYQHARQLIGNTPVLFYKNINGNNIYLKLEQYNFAGSVKDRIALSMVDYLVNNGTIKPGMTVVEATSGNTGIGLAFVLATYGIKFVNVMPDSVTKERTDILRAYGSEVIFTPAIDGMDGAKAKAAELSRVHGYHYIDQFNNFRNPAAHMETTAQEIVSDFPRLDYMVLGIGTSGTIHGLYQILPKHFPDIKFIAVEPKESPVLSGGEKNKHGIPGISPGFIPPFYQFEFAERIVQIASKDAHVKANELAKQGLFFGVSTAATILACEALAKTVQGKEILTIACDNGWKYLSMDIYGK